MSLILFEITNLTSIEVDQQVDDAFGEQATVYLFLNDIRGLSKYDLQRQLSSRECLEHPLLERNGSLPWNILLRNIIAVNVVKEFTQVEAAALIKEVNSLSVSFISDSVCVFLSFVRTPKFNKLQTQSLGLVN